MPTNPGKMQTILLRIFYIFSLSLATSVLAIPPSSDPCASVPVAQQRACYQQQFAQADQKLNAVYKRLIETLGAERIQEMRDHSRQWIAYKEALCLEATGIQHSLEPEQARQQADYFACLYALTIARTTFLTQAFAREGVVSGLAGAYDDSFGGHFTLKHQGGENYAFHLEVVRGPTYHLGEVEGSVRWQGQQGTFVQTHDCGGDTPCCRLTLVQKPTFLALEEDNCHLLRGARAYFAGRYYKVQ